MTAFTPARARSVFHTQANVMVEMAVKASRTYTDPFNQVSLDVIFVTPAGTKLRVPAFWDEGNTWKVRYSSPIPGVHRFYSDISAAQDAGLHGLTGEVVVSPYEGNNPLYRHGPLRVAVSRRYLEYADGTPFFWLGDTWWMGLCHRLHWPDEFKTLTADRQAKGFNVVQIVAGLYPDMPPFDPRGANEAGFPWERDFSRIRPAYFDAADRRIEYLAQSGLMPCIVGAWGYFMPLMGVRKAEQHWRYLVARYGALPVTWCVAGEANLPYYLAKGFPYDDRQQVKNWTAVARYLRNIDPFHRPLTIHPTGIGRLSARHAIDDSSLLDIDMLQTPHGQRDAVAPTVNTVGESYADSPVMPVINGEASYEMLNDSLPTEWTRRMFWLCLMNGAAGHTYGANGIWQCNRRGQPHGKSPHGGSYGVIPWDVAMKLPGSRQVGLGKKLLEQYPWQRFVPHPEWASFAPTVTLPLDRSRWIWFPEGNPARDAPSAKRFFRRVITIPPGTTVTSARLRIAVDDAFRVRLNGKQVGSGKDWRSPAQLEIDPALFRPGANVLAVEAENRPAPTANPAGLIAALELSRAGSPPLEIVTDAAWRCSPAGTPGWDMPGFDYAAWALAMVIGSYGDGPWGRLDPQSDTGPYGPQSTGIPGGVRVIYAPEGRSLTLHALAPGAEYTASIFDPVTGSSQGIPSFRAGPDGGWSCPPPAGIGHDWVLVLEPVRSESEKPRAAVRWLLASPPLGRAGQFTTVSAFIGTEGGPVTAVPRLELPPDVRVVSTQAPAVLRLADAEGQILSWRVTADRETAGSVVLKLRTGSGTVSAALPLHFLPPVRIRRLGTIPEPRPAPTSLLIGALDCPLWEADKFSMWDQVLKHPERTPALGFYAQENPEVADWETKWALEHGISFFTYCWYRTSQGGPVTTAFSSAIEKALYHSRFVGKFRYAIMWENQSRGTAGVANERDLLVNLLPFWIRRYFKHPSYLKVDQKPVLFIYRPEFLVQDLGSVTNVRAAFDKMRQACRQAGFGGLYILGEYRGLDAQHLTLMKQLGLDYTFAYVWGVGGNPTPEQAAAQQMNDIRETERLGIIPEVATVSQGWTGWNDEGSIWRLPPAEYTRLLQQARTFLSTLPAGELGSRMLLLDNWNEYSEGHYIAPHVQYGFEYLDAIRKVFSTAREPHQDLLPQDVGMGPYDRVFRTHLEEQWAVRQRAMKRAMKPGAGEPGLVGWWSFDEPPDSPVALDDSGHRQGGEVHASRAPGLDGMALVCDGGTVSVQPGPRLKPASALTLECWVRTDRAGQDNTWMINHVFGGATSAGYRLGILGGMPCFEVPLTDWSHHLKADVPLPTGRWVYLAGTFDGQTMRVYVDGELHGTMARPGPIHPSPFGLCLGSYDVNHPAHFTGLLDEVKLYDRALGPDEIRAHYRRLAGHATAANHGKQG